MSRNPTVSANLPVLCVEIDPWRCAGPLGPSFTSVRGLVNAAGHAVASAVTGRSKEMTQALNLLNRDFVDINALLKNPNWSLDVMGMLLSKANADFAAYRAAKAIRDGPSTQGPVYSAGPSPPVPAPVYNAGPPAPVPVQPARSMFSRRSSTPTPPPAQHPSHSLFGHSSTHPTLPGLSLLRRSSSR
jgi:hypothetical protein